MSSNDIEVLGESDIHGVPDQLGSWALETEEETRLVWKRDLDETRRDPDDGKQKPAFEWVVVSVLDNGRAWLAVLRQGFEDVPMDDRVQLREIERAPNTDEGRQEVLNAAIDLMIERSEEAQAAARDDDEVIWEVVSEQEAEEIGRWRRVEPERALADAGGDVLVQWQDRDDEIAVLVTRTDREDTTRYDAQAVPVVEGLPFGKKSIEFAAATLETALDEGIDWMRRHRPGVPVPVFSLRIEGGIFKPLMEVVYRLGGQKILVEVRAESVVFESASHVNAVEFRIPASDMEAFSVEREGEFTATVSDFWDALKSVNYGDPVPVSLDDSGDRPRLQVAAQGSFVRVAADYFDRGIPEPHPFDARFTIDGLEFRDKITAVGVIEHDSAVFGTRAGVVFIHVEDPETGELATARLDTTSVEGEQVVVVNPGRLQELRRAMPRPSQTPISFTLRGGDPMLAEYTVGETDVDVTIALKTGAVPVEVELPPVEVQVPDAAPGTAPDDAALDEAIGEFVEEAVSATEEEPADDGPPVPPAEAPPPEETVEIVVQPLGGTRAYSTADPVPNMIVSEAVSAAEDVLGRPDQFDLERPVGEITFRGEEIMGVRFPAVEDGDDELTPAPTGATDAADQEDDSEPAGVRAGFGRTVEDTFTEEVIEAGDLEEEEVPIEEPGEEEPANGDDEPGDLLDLPIQVAATLGGRSIYAPPPNEVSMSVSDDIDEATRDELGPAFRFENEQQVGTAFVTDVTPATSRELVRVEVDEEPPPDDDADEEPADDGAADTPEAEFTRGEIETIIEQATVDVVAAAQVVAGDLREVKLRPAGEGVFQVSGEELLVRSGASPAEKIRAALSRWRDAALVEDLAEDAIEEVNQRRIALSDQFGIDLPTLTRPVPPPAEELDLDVESVLDAATSGVIIDVRANESADSLRIQFEVESGSGAMFSRNLNEVQGQLSNPGTTIREALGEWEEAVHLTSVDVEAVNEEREQASREFDITLPSITPPGEEPASAEERGSLLDRWRTLMEDLESVPIDEDTLIEQPGLTLSVDVDQEFSAFADEEEKTQIERGLQIHHTDLIHEDIHAIIAQVLGAEPENFYDSSKPSDLAGYDLFYTFTLSRGKAPGAWTNPRFDPSTLFQLLEPINGEEINVVSLGAPLT